MIRTATPKLKSLVGIAAFCLFAGLSTGLVELVVVAAPLVVALVLGLSSEHGPEADASLALITDRGVEGDEFDVEILIDAHRHAGEVEVGLMLPDGIERVDKARSAIIPAARRGATTHTVKLRATRWGAHLVGPVALRLPGPGGLVTFERFASERVAVRIYPAFERIERSLRPSDTQIYSGDYVSRSSGDGIEFAQVRPFTPGDSVRRVNWRVTSRRGQLHVNLAHPERNADVVLFLDTFTDTDLPEGTTLDLTVRGAAAVAQHHLQHNDRIGLVSFGGMLRWITASMGRTHAYRIADFLLDVNATFSYAWKDIELLPQGTLPPSALVVAFSPLVDERALRALSDISARGFSLVVVNTLPEDLIPAKEGAEGRLAHRVWKLRREMLRAEFHAAGVPVVTWSGQGNLESVLARVPPRGRRRAGVRP